jgi:hypothetical protein
MVEPVVPTSGVGEGSRSPEGPLEFEGQPVAPRASEELRRVGVERTGEKRVAQLPPKPAPYPPAMHGLVIDERTEVPVSGASVTLTLHDAADPVNAQRLAETNHSGQFHIADVEPGRWSAIVEVRGRGARRVEGSFGRGESPAQVVVRVAGPRIVIVRLVGDDGLPLSRSLEEQRVTLPDDAVLVEGDQRFGVLHAEGEGGRERPIRGRNRDLPAIGTTGTWGRAEFRAENSSWFASRGRPDPLDTPLLLGEPPPRHVAVRHGHVVLGEALVPETGDTVEVVVRLGLLARRSAQVRFRCVSADSGDALPTARASLLAPRKFGAAGHRADQEGIVRIEDVDAGPRWLTVLAPGHQWFQRELVVPESEGEVDLGTIALARAARIRGRIVGGPSGSIEVTAFPLESFEETRAMRGSLGVSSAPPDRLWELQGLGRERYLLRLRSAEWAALPVVVDTSEGDVEGVELLAERGTEVRFQLREPRADGLLRIEADRLPVTEREVAGTRELSVRLVPGRYTWRIEQAGRTTVARDLDVGPRDLVVPVAD